MGFGSKEPIANASVRSFHSKLGRIVGISRPSRQHPLTPFSTADGVLGPNRPRTVTVHSQWPLPPGTSPKALPLNSKTFTVARRRQCGWRIRVRPKRSKPRRSQTKEESERRRGRVYKLTRGGTLPCFLEFVDIRFSSYAPCAIPSSLSLKTIPTFPNPNTLYKHTPPPSLHIPSLFSDHRSPKESN